MNRHHANKELKNFKSIFEQYFQSLCAFGYKYISDAHAVEDLVQEAFSALWELRKDIEHPNARKSFLYTSVKNKCLNHIKHQAVMQKHESAIAYQLESEQYFANQIIEEDTFRLLHQEIKNLPDGAHKIMLLALNGLSNSEIAEELDVSVNTVKTQKKIAYAKLKIKLAPEALSLFFL